VTDRRADRQRLEFKARLALARYYARSASRWVWFTIPLAVFLLSFLLFAILLIPNFGRRLSESDVLSQAPHALTINGVVTQATIGQDGTRSENPVPGAVIEGGGFRTVADEEGSYELEFRSGARQDIPIVFRQNDREEIARICFPPGCYRVQLNHTFR